MPRPQQRTQQRRQRKPRTEQPITSTTRERVDGAAVEWLLNNKEFVDALQKEAQLKKNEQKRKCSMSTLRHYKTHDYSVDVEYKHGKGREDGREYGIAFCLQRFQGFLRRLTTRGLLRDWDMANAFATLLFWWCRSCSKLHPSEYKELKYYTENRDAIFARLGPITHDRRDRTGATMLDRDGMKAAFTGMPMGAGKDIKVNDVDGVKVFCKVEVDGKEVTKEMAVFTDPWVMSYYNEMKGIMDAVAKAFPADYNAVRGGGNAADRENGGEVYNAKGKCMSRVLGRFESQVLDVMRAVADEQGVQVVALIFDGFMTGAQVPVDFAARMEAAVRDRLGIDMTIIEKPIKREDVRAKAASLNEKRGVALNDLPGLDAFMEAQDALVAAHCVQGPIIQPEAEDDAVPTLADDSDDEEEEEEEEEVRGARMPDNLGTRTTQVIGTGMPRGMIREQGLCEGVFRHPVKGVVMEDGRFVNTGAKLMLNHDTMALGKSHQMKIKVLHHMSGGRIEELEASFDALDDEMLERDAAGEFVDAPGAEPGTAAKRALWKARGELGARWAQANGGPIVCGTQRCTMVTATMSSHLERYGFRRYNSNGIDGTGYGDISLSEFPLLVVEYESWHRVFGMPGMLVFDEFRSLISTMVSPTNGKDGSLIVAHLGQLRAMVENTMCTDVLMLDADAECDGAVARVIAHMQGWCQQFRLRTIDEKRRAATQELVDAVQGGCDEETVAAARAAMMAACEEEAAVRASPPDRVVDTTTGYKKSKRNVVIMRSNAALDRLMESAEAGKRVAVMFGRKCDAKAFADVLAEALPDLDVGLYTSDSNKVQGNVEELWRHHDVIIFTSVYTTGADYQAEVDEVYVIPHTGVATPRDMMQGSGRLRNVKSNTVYVGVGEDSIRTLPIQRSDIDAQFEKEMELMGRARDTRAALMSSAKKGVLYNMNPNEAAQMELKQTDDALLDMYGFVRAEQHFARTWKGWVGWWRYMCELKEYRVTVDARKAKTMKVKGKTVSVMQFDMMIAMKGLKEERVAMYKKLDVSALVDDYGFAKLQGYTNGGVGLTDEEKIEFEARHPDIKRGETAHIALRKATACRVARIKDGKIDHDCVDTVLRLETAIRTHEVVQHMTAGVDVDALENDVARLRKQREVATERAAQIALDFAIVTAKRIHQSAVRDTTIMSAPARAHLMKCLSGDVPLEGQSANVVERAIACTDVLDAIGLSYARVMKGGGCAIPDFDPATMDHNRRLSAVLRRATDNGVFKTTQENLSNWDKVRDVLTSNLGLGSTKTGRIRPTPTISAVLGMKNRVSPAKWFREQHGATMVLDESGRFVNNFEPSTSMQVVELQYLANTYTVAGHPEIAARARECIVDKTESEARWVVENRERVARLEAERLERARVFQENRIAGDARRAAKRAREKELFMGEVKRARVDVVAIAEVDIDKAAAATAARKYRRAVMARKREARKAQRA